MMEYCICTPIDAKQIMILISVTAAMVAATLFIRHMTDR